MKVAIAFHSKDNVALSEQTIQRLAGRHCDVFWQDGSSTDEGKKFFETYDRVKWTQKTRVTGGPDAAIVFSLSQMLSNPEYTHVGILEQDVLLPHNWFNDCMHLFHYSKSEGLHVGAVSARSYVDRILLQRDGYSVLHNAGAGHIILSREAARLVLANYRNGWTSENRRIFSILSGYDIGKFWAFAGQEHPITCDWWFDALLASHGYATLAPSPCYCEMLGQPMPLEQQGLKLADKPVEERKDDVAFHRFRNALNAIHDGKLVLPKMDFRMRWGTSTTIFPHHLPKLGVTFTGNWRRKWSQGLGPFAYVAGEGGACLTVPIFGTCACLIAGDGAVVVRDEVTGFRVNPPLPGGDNLVNISIPGGMLYRSIVIEASEGVVFLGFDCDQEQPFDPNATFDFNTLPPELEKTREAEPA